MTGAGFDCAVALPATATTPVGISCVWLLNAEINSLSEATRVKTLSKIPYINEQYVRIVDNRLVVEKNLANMDIVNFKISRHIYATYVNLTDELQRNGYKVTVQTYSKVVEHLAANPTARTTFRELFDEYCRLKTMTEQFFVVESPAELCAVIEQQHPLVKVRIMEGQLLAMINELRQGELDFTINTYYPGPYDHEFSFEKLFEKPFAVFARAGHPAAQATSLGELMDHHWTMPTPRGSYFKQLQERFEQLGREPKVGIVCETFSSCISLVVKSDFLSILPVELGNDPLMADKLVMIPIREVLPTATYYLIQRRDTRQTPLTASLITLFRRQSRQLFP